MNRSLPAALLSALVFPGAGQIYLERRRRGWAIVFTVLAALLYLLSHIAGPLMALADEIKDGRLALDPLLIASRVHALGLVDNPALTAALLVIVACWAGSTIDAFVLGRRGAPA